MGSEEQVLGEKKGLNAIGEDDEDGDVESLSGSIVAPTSPSKSVNGDEVPEDDAEPQDFTCGDCLPEGAAFHQPEQVPIRKPANPSGPTAKEREAHNTVHLPYRSWCKICVEARGHEDPHYKSTAEELQEGITEIAMDYASVGEAVDESDHHRLLIGKDK